MKTTKSQVEVLQMLKEVSKDLDLKFEIESHNENLGVYRIHYGNTWSGVGTYQFTCITDSTGNTNIDMELVTYVPIRKSYQPMPRISGPRYQKYYNSTLAPALNKAMGNEVKASINEKSVEPKVDEINVKETKEEKAVSSNDKSTAFESVEEQNSNLLPIVMIGVVVVGLLLFVVGSNGGGLSKPDPCKCIDYGGMAAVSSSYAPKNTKEWNKCIKAYGNATRMTNECIDKR